MKTVTLEITQEHIATISGGQQIKVDLGNMHQNGIEAIIRYGVQRIINDAANGGGKDSTPEERLAQGQKKLDALIIGNVSARSGGSRISDTEKEIRAIVKSALIKKGLSASDADKQAKQWQELVPEAGHDALIAKAEKNVKARSFEVELDLGE